MSELLNKTPYSKRDNRLFLKELTNITKHHLKWCKEYGSIWSKWKNNQRIEDFPFIHVGLFKHLAIKTIAPNIKHKRIVQSSSTSGVSSNIHTDTLSSELHVKSTQSIFSDYLGKEKCPLIIVDSVKSLYKRGGTSARIAAAMSLKFLSSDITFLLDNSEDFTSTNWDRAREILGDNNEIIIYGFSWILWKVWNPDNIPTYIKKMLKGKKVKFVHSGGWKKLESERVERDYFDKRLLEFADPTSIVVDYYGLVEQLGIVYPLCQKGFRHIPVWADILIRDSYTLDVLSNEIGQIQLINTITWGAPYHNVLTEDLGRLIPGECSCGRRGKRFELIGRIPKAEIRGCANV